MNTNFELMTNKQILETAGAISELYSDSGGGNAPLQLCF